MYKKPTDVQSVRLVEEYPVLRIINAEGPASKATMLALAKMQGRPLYGKAYIAYLEGAEAYFKGLGIDLPFQWTVASISPEEMEAMCPTPKVYVPRPAPHAPTAEELALAEFKKFSRPVVKQPKGYRDSRPIMNHLDTKAFSGF